MKKTTGRRREAAERTDDLWLRMGRCASAYSDFVKALSRPLSFQKLRVLDQVCRRKRLIMKDLCAALGIQPSEACVLVRALASAGLVTQRREGRHDRRRVQVRPTAQGLRFWEDRTRRGRGRVASMFAGWPVKDRDRFAQALDGVTQRLRQWG